MTSKALWGGAIALVVAVVLVGGIWVGSAISERRLARAEGAATATRQAASTKVVKPGGPTPTPELVQVPGQAAPKPGMVGTVLDVTGNEITIKTRQGPTGRIMVGPNTIVRRRGQRIAIGDVRVGAEVIAVGRVNVQQRTLQANLVVVDPPVPRR
jgi:hypothetical protein